MAAIQARWAIAGSDDKPKRVPPAWLRALGRADLPPSMRFGEDEYRYVRTFKHDFFAVTALYEGEAGKVVLKMGRTASLFGLPMRWIGRALARHEIRLYRMFQDVASAGGPGVPRFIGAFDDTGFVHAYIEGADLAAGQKVDDAFFPALRQLVAAIHARDAAYVDLNKPQNILVDVGGRPWLIDFQISWHVRGRVGRAPPASWILRILQRADTYHLLKQVRRFRPDQLSEAERRRVATPPLYIRAHRWIARPLIQLRRSVLVRLGARAPAMQAKESGQE